MDGHPEAVVDLAAIRTNTARLNQHVGRAQLMAVVKSDGYGHGMLPAARAATAGGATWLGVTQLADGIELRRSGQRGPVLCLSAVADAAHDEAIRQDIDLTAGSVAVVEAISAASARAGKPARVHLKADTGMGRGGATAADWPALLRAALAAEAAGQARVVAVWSHLACADIPGHPSIAAQLAAFRSAVERAERAGARLELRHLANTAAALTLPDSRFDLVRVGGGIFGLATLPGGPPAWLRPAMTVRAQVIQVKRVPPGAGVSYGHRYTTSRHTTLALAPLGYYEGVPRRAGNVAPVLIRGQRCTIAGTVCMNQFVVDVGNEPVTPGDELVLFGPGDSGEPTAQQWADALGTISYEVVIAFSGRLPRNYAGVSAELAGDGRADGQVAAAH
jgi:alanine racemase